MTTGVGRSHVVPLTCGFADRPGRPRWSDVTSWRGVCLHLVCTETMPWFVVASRFTIPAPTYPARSFNRLIEIARLSDLHPRGRRVTL